MPAEPVGIEYGRLLDEIRDRIADPVAVGHGDRRSAAGRPRDRGGPAMAGARRWMR
ncbi:hypothetical protein [Micromonospora sp. CA-111912]|uniref:hypothetical protein n=1 Tax=Micromonospora sp. CA-111912 TaxID=3239955 RepID=UPI003D9265ED